MYRSIIDPIIWLEEILSNFGVEAVDVECFEVDNGQLMQCRVGFSIAARRGRGVVQILEVGRKAPDKAIAQKYGVLACVNKLANIGCNLPTYSSMTIQAIDADSYHDVAGFYARMAQNNQNDVVSRSRTHSLYLDLLLLESLVLISFFLPTLNYRLRTMT
jgi:hypothetical protein